MNNIDIDVICWGYFLSFIFCSKDFVFLPDLNCVFFWKNTRLERISCTL